MSWRVSFLFLSVCRPLVPDWPSLRQVYSLIFTENILSVFMIVFLSFFVHIPKVRFFHAVPEFSHIKLWFCFPANQSYCWGSPLRFLFGLYSISFVASFQFGFSWAILSLCWCLFLYLRFISFFNLFICSFRVYSGLLYVVSTYFVWKFFQTTPHIRQENIIKIRTEINKKYF